jgi:hypothetical protein
VDHSLDDKRTQIEEFKAAIRADELETRETAEIADKKEQKLAKLAKLANQADRIVSRVYRQHI